MVSNGAENTKQAEEATQKTTAAEATLTPPPSKQSPRIPLTRLSRSARLWLIANWTGILVGVLGGLIGTIPFKWLEGQKDERIQSALLIVLGDIENQIRTTNLQGGLKRIEHLELQLPEGLNTVIYGRMQEIKAEGLLRLLDIGEQEEARIDAALVALDGAERAAEKHSDVIMPSRIMRLRCEALRRRSEIRRAMGSAMEALHACDKAIENVGHDRHSYEGLRTRTERAIVLRILGELSDDTRYLDQGETELKPLLTQSDALRNSELQFLVRNTLGTVYMRRAQRGGLGDSDRAIATLKEALQFAPQEESPIAWARAQLNLCSSYRSDALRADAQRLRAAIEACDEASKILTKASYPRAYAMVRTSLSGVYSLLALIEDRELNLHSAVSEAKEAIAALSLERFPVEYARAHHNLGYAYASLAELGQEPSENAKLAVHALRQALNGRMRSTYPYEYFQSRTILAWTHTFLAKFESPVSNLRQAIAILNEEIAVANARGRLLDVARCNVALGEAYSALILHESPSENLSRALAAFETTKRYYIANANSFHVGSVDVLKADAVMNFAEASRDFTGLAQAQAMHDLASQYINEEEAPEQYAALKRSRERLNQFRLITSRVRPE